MVVLKEEIDTCMRLLGVTRLDQLGPQYVSHDSEICANNQINTNALEHMVYNPPGYVETFAQFVKAKL
jgi:hypothetical protein